MENTAFVKSAGSCAHNKINKSKKDDRPDGFWLGNQTDHQVEHSRQGYSHKVEDY